LDSNPKLKQAGVEVRVTELKNGCATLTVTRGLGRKARSALMSGQSVRDIYMGASTDVGVLIEAEEVLKKRPDLKDVVWRVASAEPPEPASFPTLIPNVPQELAVPSNVIMSAQVTFAALCGSGFYAPSLSALATPPKAGDPAFIGGKLVPSPGSNAVQYEGFKIEIDAPPDPSSPASCNGLGPGKLARSFRAIATNATGAFLIAQRAKMI
jgi:hypothetical protein